MLSLYVSVLALRVAMQRTAKETETGRKKKQQLEIITKTELRLPRISVRCVVF